MADLRASQNMHSTVLLSSMGSGPVGEMNQGEGVAQSMGYSVCSGESSEGENPLDGTSSGVSHFKLSLEDIASWVLSIALWTSKKSR